MNPLLTLWLLVLSVTILLSVIFYMAENYSHIIGNFYFLIGAFFGSYFLYILVTWLIQKNRKKPTP